MKQTPAIKSPPLSVPMANSHLLLSSAELTLRWVMGMLPSLDDPFWAQINLFLRQGVSMKKTCFFLARAVRWNVRREIIISVLPEMEPT